MSDKSELGFKHKSGILMPVFSLPSKYGIGSFGKECFEFLDFLKKCDQKVWQVLPLNPTSFGDSPYQSPSSYAGNPYFINLDILASQGLLDKEDLKQSIHNTDLVDYGWLFENRYPILRKAYSRFSPTNEYVKFVKNNMDWVYDYALFMALKVKNNFASWDCWPGEDKVYGVAQAHANEQSNEIGFWLFLQYEFYREWDEVRKYAKSLKIDILGDMPIYVAYDSVEVWSHPKMFKLDNNLVPELVAGVPPDGFTADGQLWGNPIYNWQLMKDNGFDWWLNRINHSKKLYDILRIDHFRGFAGYYVVPFGEKTAKNGWWEKGFGIELFQAIKENIHGIRIIAEDLGVITDDVRELLDFTGYPGMKVLQFAFGCENSEYLPRNYKNSNCVVYTGTHDNQTSCQWIHDLNGYELKMFNKECKRVKGEKRIDTFISFALGSKADLAVIPLQDYMGLNGKARINMPSTDKGNWQWRITKKYITNELINKVVYLKKQNKR